MAKVRDIEGLGYEADALGESLLNARDEETMVQTLREAFES